MPDPREAIYDVLRSKWQRAQDEKELTQWQVDWATYEEANARAAAEYPHLRRNPRKARP